DSSFNHAGCLLFGIGRVTTKSFLVVPQCVIGEDKSFIDFVARKSTQLLMPRDVGIPFIYHGLIIACAGPKGSAVLSRRDKNRRDKNKGPQSQGGNQASDG